MSRSYCITLNNYTLEDLAAIYQEAYKWRYLIVSAEVGKKGTKHLQCYIELWKTARLSAFKEGCWSRAHLEPRRGDRESARNYCMKEGDYAEFGHWEAGGQGRRNDIRAVMKMVKERKSMLEIMETEPTLASRHLKFIDRYTAEVEKEETREFRHVDVQVYVGEAGCGKTKKAFDENPGIFVVDSETNFPFDGYAGETAILIDDFYGGIKYGSILRILDGHQMKVTIKGGLRYAKWNKVIITSNKQPDQWYKRGLTPALKRRLSSVTTFCNEESGNTSALPSTATNEPRKCDYNDACTAHIGGPGCLCQWE